MVHSCDLIMSLSNYVINKEWKVYGKVFNVKV